MIKGAIFDFDGTLFDSMYVWENLGMEYMRSIGYNPPSELQSVLNSMSVYDSACYCKKKFDLTLSVKDIINGFNGILENYYFNAIKPKAGIIPFLNAMQMQNIKMCIATATDKYLVQTALERCKMNSFFSEIFTCFDVGYGKESPIIFRCALNALKTVRKNTLIFEDACYAIETAKKDGFLVVGVYDLYEKKANVVKNLTDFYLADFQNTKYFWEFASKL